VSSARLAAQLRDLQAEIDSPKTLLSALDSPTPAARVKALREEAAQEKAEAEAEAQAAVEAATSSAEAKKDAQGQPVGPMRSHKATTLLPEVSEVAQEADEDLAAIAQAEAQEVHNQRLLDEMRRGVVLYDYHRTWKSTLDVRKGDHITILDITSDPNSKWWLVKSEQGVQGWLPKQFVQHRPWANPAHISTVTAALGSTGALP
jgi:uncharacterized protein YgiM (DUF1202 family)